MSGGDEPAVEAALQHAGLVQEVAEDVDQLGEGGPLQTVVLPAVQHERVQRLGAEPGRGQPVAGLDQLYDLSATNKS